MRPTKKKSSTRASKPKDHPRVNKPTQPMKINNDLKNQIMQVSFRKHVCLLYAFVSILLGTSNSISLNLMLPKLKFNVLPNDHK